MVLVKDKAESEKLVLMNFNVPESFYKIYKQKSQEKDTTMKNIFIESFYVWSGENGSSK